MRIVLVAPVEETVPPLAYGGIEQTVHLLDEDLVARGHDVTLLASGGSEAAGRLVPLTTEALARPGTQRQAELLRARKDRAARRAAEIIAEERPDAVLNHSWRILDYLRTKGSLTTIHYPLNVEPYRGIYFARRNTSYVSISGSQRHDAPDLPFAGTVYNGIDVAALPYSRQPGQYLAYLGRVSPEKGLDIAIRVAQTAGIHLKIGAKLDNSQRPWFDAVVAPLVRRGGVELMGEVATRDKGAFLAGALALLHPSRWQEPFGLAAVEAMACGTPVLALNRGAAAEIVDHGHTGFVVDDEAGLVAAIQLLHRIERSACREHVAARFDRRHMAEQYEKLAVHARNTDPGALS